MGSSGKQAFLQWRPVVGGTHSGDPLVEVTLALRSQWAEGVSDVEPAL